MLVADMVDLEGRDASIFSVGCSRRTVLHQICWRAGESARWKPFKMGFVEVVWDGFVIMSYCLSYVYGPEPTATLS